jgi:thiol-disulfide isomerase/thioredoxin
VAHATLHELRNLRVGKVAPDIVGDDLDGKRLKLSDSRGRVTLLVFWGHWCGPCMAMVPQERKLAERYAGKPFNIVGVNSDEERVKARDVASRKKMTWRSFWEGDERRISREWNIHGYPETYVLDAAGVIRFRGVVRDDLDKAVAELVAELEKK